MFYDEEAIYQDADIEQAEWESLGRDVDRAEKAGRCTHGATVGYRNPPVYAKQIGLKPGESRCRDCGRKFVSDADWVDARDEAVYG